MHTPPPKAVLDAFSVHAVPVRLPGGEGRTFLAGDTVLKPVANQVEAAWIAETLRGLDGRGRFCVPRPIAARSGGWIAESWVAWERVDGEHRSGQWPQVLAVGDALHEALSGIPEPSFLSARQTPWAIGDRVAWGADPPTDVPRGFLDLLARLASARRPLRELPQVIHGDLCGNVLFADGQPPAVIDFSPFFRPANYAKAIVAFDAVAWEGADPELFEADGETSDREQLLIRAAMFRVTAGGLLMRGDPRRAGDRGAAPYERMVRLLTSSD
ncbi:MAG: hypothetical protein WEB13_07510 [Dehalococcoidia bacterium]